MSKKTLPWSVAEAVSKERGFDQVIIWAWDKQGNRQWVATYGRTIMDSDQAAQGGNHIKKTLLKWPDDLCMDEPNRVRKLRDRIRELEAQLDGEKPREIPK